MITLPASKRAAKARKLVEDLQSLWVHRIEQLRLAHGNGDKLQQVHWLRDKGRHGGGNRYADFKNDLFNRIALNFSSVHYDDIPEKKLGSATALSCIVHPHHPLAPSLHTHISWTELKSGQGSWRIMADLNPSIPNDEERATFAKVIKEVANEHYEHGTKQGDKYFFIPSLKKHRGQFHFYLEGHATNQPDSDLEFAQRFGVQTIAIYTALLDKVLKENGPIDQSQKEKQLDYHTLYFYQVVLLDRGTTSGILVHDQNDQGILGSLPQFINSTLLKSWLEQTPELQRRLLNDILSLLPDSKHIEVDAIMRKKLAETIRNHYANHPEALALQASGFVIPAALSRHQD